MYYNRSAKDLTPLKPVDVVRIQPSQTLGSSGIWEKGVVSGVVSGAVQKRSYEVETDRGTIRRNRRHLRISNENKPAMSDYDMDIDIDSNPTTS